MKYYLSSYKFGDHKEKLKQIIPSNSKIGHINNARDSINENSARANRHQQEEIATLNQLGFEAEPLDLKSYFNKTNELKQVLDTLAGVWVSGGNTFVLRMAVRLSGFDTIFEELKDRDDFCYAGYSAGICILSNTLKPIETVDHPNSFPYQGIKQPIYEGLGRFNYAFMPHYKSDHPESELVDKAIQKCIDNKWLFKALRDGDVIIID